MTKPYADPVTPTGGTSGTASTKTKGATSTATIDKSMLPADFAALMSWLPQSLIDIYINAWVETGNSAMAWGEVRTSPEYETYFPGIVRDDGTLRMTELEYMGNMAAYRQTVSELGLNPDLFTSQYVNLITGEKSPDEFQAQVDALAERVWFASDEIRQAYFNEGYADAASMSLEALIASVLDPDVGNLILNQQITMAEILGEGAIRGLDVDTELAADLLGAGFDRTAATQLFGQAAEWLPVLGVLAARHNDPDDPFDLDEFVTAEVYNGFEAKQLMRRLVSQERASFTESGYFGTATSDVTGGLTGLRER